MTSKKVGYSFKPLPAELPVTWMEQDLYPRLILIDLWRMSGNGVLNTRLKYLVRDMRITKKGDRVAAAKAIAWLVEDGLLKESDQGVEIALGVRWECVGNAEVPSKEIPTKAKPSKSLPADFADQRDQIRSERSDHARENSEPEPEPKPEPFVPARRPAPEPPAGFVDTYQPPPAEPSLDEQLINLWRQAVMNKTGRYPGSTSHVAAGAARLAAWLRENVRGGETPLALFKTALKQYVADDTKALVKACWPLAWMEERMPGYLAVYVPSRPTPGLWVPPDYMREDEPEVDSAPVSKAVVLDFPGMAELGVEVLARLAAKSARSTGVA